MARDPYGFTDTAPATLGGGTGTPSDASKAMWLALTSALLGSVGICFCYVPYVVALPMGIYAAYLGSRTLQTVKEENLRQMATAGMVSGILSSVVSGLFTLFFLLYFLMVVAYFGLIVVAVVAGAASEI